MHGKFPILESKRLLLTRAEENDIPLIKAYAGNRKIADSTLNIPHPYAEKDAEFWIQNTNRGFEAGTQFSFAIRLKPENAFIGAIGLTLETRFDRAEMGYWIAEPYWNMGLATEAVAVVLDFGFNGLDLNKILATHLLDNPASGKVMINNLMIREGELKEHTKKNGMYQDLIQYRLTRKEFLAIQNDIQ